jgi:hypothetical protein
VSPSPGKPTTLRTVGIPCLYKSYKLHQAHSPRVSFPSPAHRPVGEGLFFIHIPTGGAARPSPPSFRTEQADFFIHTRRVTGRASPPSFRTEQADFFIRIRAGGGAALPTVIPYGAGRFLHPHSHGRGAALPTVIPNGAGRFLHPHSGGWRSGPPHRHSERSRPISSSPFTPVKGSACGCEESLFSLEAEKLAQLRLRQSLRRP